MAGSSWRLLAAFLLILLAALLHAQDAASPQPLSATESLLLRYKPEIPAAVPESRSTSSSNRSGNYPPAEAISYNAPPQAPGLPQFARSAAIIFLGTVSSISPAQPSMEHGYTAVTFKVAQAIRGTEAGQPLTIHEWAGLWSSGERYRVGEKVMLFLYSPSRLGLTSPVSGGTGRFAVNLKGEILLTPQHMQLFAGDPVLAGKGTARFEDFASALQRVRGIE